MKKTKNIPSYMGSVESFEGESIEKKVSKLIENNEPITGLGAGNYNLTITDRIVTDKWDIAQSAMDLANASKIEIGRAHV